MCRRRKHHRSHRDHRGFTALMVPMTPMLSQAKDGRRNKPKMAEQKPEQQSKASRPAPDDAERKAIEKAVKRSAAREPRVTVNFNQGVAGKVDLDGGGHSDHEGWLTRLVDAFGTRGTPFAISQLNQLMTACRDEAGKIDSTRVNAMLAMVEAAEPENEIQAALAVQMAVTHFATMAVMARALRVDQIPQFDSAGNMTVKLARTFALQAEALVKLQRRGEQVVKVVHVHPGGQAIVGNVNAPGTGATGEGGGITDENRNRPHAKAIEAASGALQVPPLWGKDEEREPVPVASSQK